MASWAATTLLHSWTMFGSQITRTTFNQCRRHLTSSTAKIPTIQEVIDQIFVTVGGQKIWKPQDYDRSKLEAILPKTQSELPQRNMKHSYGEALVPLGSDVLLREKYMNPIGGLRFGRILEDLDVFAVWLCYKFVLNPKQEPNSPSPFTIVTALVDSINVAGRKLKIDKDFKLSGHVSWVGTTSMETCMKLEQKDDDNNWQELLQAYFVMVARDPLNRGSAIINQLVPETDAERAMFEQGEENKKHRILHAQESLLKIPPNEQERAHIHEIYLKTLDPKDQSFKVRVLPAGCQWMEDAEMQTTILCQPQEKNFYQKIFGGFLMRMAFELAWLIAYVYSKSRPYVKYVDDIVFRQPVEIGSLLQFIGQIAYVSSDGIQVKVIADVIKPETGSRATTNIFHFTFDYDTSKQVPQIIPKTYGESMLYLEGKRHFEVALSGK